MSIFPRGSCFRARLCLTDAHAMATAAPATACDRMIEVAGTGESKTASEPVCSSFMTFLFRPASRL